MTSEPLSNETYLRLAGELTSTEVSQFAIPKVSQPSQFPADDADLDNEDVSLTKAPTLMMDQEPDEPDSSAFRTPIETAPRYYIQGVVQGQRAYVVTNLLAGESQTLFQPQMVWTIGRNRDAAFPLRDRVLSRRHAVILYVQNEGFYLIDLNSMNGSFVNGSRIQQRCLLKDGDRLRLGTIEFSFFTSRGVRSIDSIHPEVLARFTGSQSRLENFIDYSALEDPGIMFKSTRE
ncbi:MAG: FHA domain-containing protein [Leptolyngbyaceae cyanobacterium RU_5_1]|nr:FHA domain-containing protein [Leptolyngbyaceae cyanobacterium RU_5_1]